jgi:UDP-N-acetylmuramate--alanine ligase
MKDVHFVGIGGVGMSGIAEILLALGFRVSGSDLAPSAATERLRRLGARVTLGHRGDNVQEADVVVFSSAIRPDNPELKVAAERHIPVIPRAEMLGELMRMQTAIAVAGMHGKTTTTSMVATALAHAGLDPTVVIGGRLDSLGGGAKLGAGGLMAAEADESDRSFLKLFPTIAVVTNMDMEHLDCYSSMDEIRRTFIEFINRVPFYGYAVVCVDDPEIRASLPEIRMRRITYGLSEDADFRGVNLSFDGRRSRFSVMKESRLLGEASIGMPGTHNVVNALAALAVADLCDAPFSAAVEALASFKGLDRRFTLRGEAAGVKIIDDYGHHPTEIRAVLSAARRIAEGRLVVMFQPHRYTRTQALFQRFVEAFPGVDRLFVMEIYPASEPPIEGVTGRRLAEALEAYGVSVRFLPDKASAPAEVAGELRPGDLLITLGAGDVTKMGGLILEELAKKECLGH